MNHCGANLHAHAIRARRRSRRLHRRGRLHERAGIQADGDRLHGDARHRHAQGRPDRVSGTAPGVPHVLAERQGVALPAGYVRARARRRPNIGHLGKAAAGHRRHDQGAACMSATAGCPGLHTAIGRLNSRIEIADTPFHVRPTTPASWRVARTADRVPCRRQLVRRRRRQRPRRCSRKRRGATGAARVRRRARAARRSDRGAVGRRRPPRCGACSRTCSRGSATMPAPRRSPTSPRRC